MPNIKPVAMLIDIDNTDAKNKVMSLSSSFNFYSIVAFSSPLKIKSPKATYKEPSELYIRKFQNSLWLAAPTQFPTKGQWWSILRTHFLQTEQWWDLGGLTSLHCSQKRYWVILIKLGVLESFYSSWTNTTLSFSSNGCFASSIKYCFRLNSIPFS